MKKRLILLAGLGAGFVLGTRAGRQSYEKLKGQVTQWWEDPRVQESVQKATDTVKEQAPIFADKVRAKATGGSSENAAAASGAAGAAAATRADRVPDVVSDPETDIQDEGPDTSFFAEGADFDDEDLAAEVAEDEGVDPEEEDAADSDEEDLDEDTRPV